MIFAAWWTDLGLPKGNDSTVLPVTSTATNHGKAWDLRAFGGVGIIIALTSAGRGVQ